MSHLEARPSGPAQRWVVLISLVLLTGLGWRIASPREPRYQGRTVSEWLYNANPDFAWIPNDVYGHVHDELWARLVAPGALLSYDPRHVLDAAGTTNERVVAVRALGSNTLPQLIQLMSSSELTASEKVRHQMAIRLPAKWGDWLYPYDGSVWGDPVMRRRIAAFDGFTFLGTNAEPALPALSNLFYSGQADLPLAWAIANIGPKGGVLLTAALQSTRSDLRDLAALALGLQYDDAKEAVPALIDCVARGNASYHILGALGRIGCDDPRLVPALIRLAGSTNASFRTSNFEPMAFLLLATYGEKAGAAGPLALAGYRSCVDPATAAGRRFYRRVLKHISPDLWTQLPPPRDSEEESDQWP